MRVNDRGRSGTESKPVVATGKQMCPFFALFLVLIPAHPFSTSVINCILTEDERSF